MEPPVLAALITSCISAVVACVSLAVGSRQRSSEAELRQRLVALDGEIRKQVATLEEQLRAEAKREEREIEAEAVIARFREPLVAAAFDLQSRLHNILQGIFLAAYGQEDDERRDDAIHTTLFRLAQYFAWAEIVRREIQFLRFRADDETRCIASLQARLASTLATDRHGREFMLWHEEQRAIGERMIATDGNGPRCIGYASFVDSYPDAFEPWLKRIERDLLRGRAATSERLVRAQHLLVELVCALDPGQTRYEASRLKRA